MALAREHNYPLKLVEAIEEVNDLQKSVLVDKILKFYCSPLADQLDEFKLRGDNGHEGAPKRVPSPAEGLPAGDYSYVLSLDVDQAARPHDDSE